MTVRLMRGDCLHLMKRLEDGSVGLVLCDLPYGITAIRSTSRASQRSFIA